MSRRSSRLPIDGPIHVDRLLDEIFLDGLFVYAVEQGWSTDAERDAIALRRRGVVAKLRGQFYRSGDKTERRTIAAKIALGEKRIEAMWQP